MGSEDRAARAAAELTATPEPWERWETRLVLGSLALGIAGLLVLGWLVARFVLP
jgi:hypothetical protein